MRNEMILEVFSFMSGNDPREQGSHLRNRYIRLDTFYKNIGEVVAQRCSAKKVLQKMIKNSQEDTGTEFSFLIKLSASCNFIKNYTSAQVFSCEFCNIFKNSCFYRTPGTASKCSLK